MQRGLLGGSKTEPFLGHLGSEEQRGGGGVRPGEQKLPGQIAWLALPRALAVPLSLFSSLSLPIFFFFFYRECILSESIKTAPVQTHPPR